MFGSNLLGLRFTILNEFILLVIVGVPLWLIARKRLREFFTNISDKFKRIDLQPVEKAMIGILIFLIISSFLSTFYWPVHIWDSVVLYDFRGHVFALTGWIKPALIDEYYYSYPLLTSLAHAIVYLCGGKYPQFLYSLFYLSLGLSFYGFLRELISRKASLFFTLTLMLTGPLFYHSLLSLTNLPFTIYLSLGAISLFLWNRKNRIEYLVLSALLVGLSTQIRSTEPFWLIPIFVILVVSIINKRIMYFIVYLLVLLPIRQIWISYRQFISVNTITSITSKMELETVLMELVNWDRWVQVISFLYKYLILPQWQLFILFVLIFLISVFRKRNKNILIFIITILFIGILVAGTFMFSVYLDYWNRIGDATERLSMLFYPLFIYCIAIVVKEFDKIDK